MVNARCKSTFIPAPSTESRCRIRSKIEVQVQQELHRDHGANVLQRWINQCQVPLRVIRRRHLVQA